jgi:hypothetical protein
MYFLLANAPACAALCPACLKNQRHLNMTPMESTTRLRALPLAGPTVMIQVGFVPITTLIFLFLFFFPSY